MEKVIFLIEGEFTQRDYHRFGIELLQKNEFEVEVWHINPILYPHFRQAYANADKQVFDNLTVFDDEEVLYGMLSGLSDRDFVISLVRYNFSSLRIYIELSKSSAQYAVLYANAIPIAGENLGMSKFFGALKKPFATVNYVPTMMKRKVLKLPLRFLKVKPARLFLVGGKGCLVYNYLVDKKTEILWLHALDYDLYLEEKKRPLQESNTAVFLDEAMPVHPEYSMFNLKPPIETERYFTLLNRFFEVIEKETGYEVTIAECPRANYKKDYFDGRKRVKGQTARLVSQSKLVISHYSTAANFANLFYKPVIFLTCSDFNKTFEEYQIKEMAKWFGKNPISMDKSEKVDWEFELKVDDGHYANYRRTYIKTADSQELPFWQMVADRLKEKV